MAKPRLLGIEVAARAKPVLERWKHLALHGKGDDVKFAKAQLKRLRTLEARVKANPLTAGDPVAHDRWPRSLSKDYGEDIPNLFRFELPHRWRGYYTLMGESAGARIWILYLWDHETYSGESGYKKK